MTSQFNFNVAKQQQPPSHLSQNSQQKNFSSIKTSSSSIPKTKLTKKYVLDGFVLTDLVWLKPADGRSKYEILVRYIDPEAPKTKRWDGSYQKIIRFGQKGDKDYTEPPHLIENKNKILQRLNSNTTNPLHPNFYIINILNGSSKDVYENFQILRRQLFK